MPRSGARISVQIPCTVEFRKTANARPIKVKILWKQELFTNNLITIVFASHVPPESDWPVIANAPPRGGRCCQIPGGWRGLELTEPLEWV